MGVVAVFFTSGRVVAFGTATTTSATVQRLKQVVANGEATTALVNFVNESVPVVERMADLDTMKDVWSGSSTDSHVPLPIILGANQVRFLNEAYTAVHESVYQSLVLQARLKPYLDAISLTIDEAGLRAEFGALSAGLEARKATDPANALIDALELQRHAGEQLGGMGWEGRRPIAADATRSTGGQQRSAANDVRWRWVA